MIRHLKLTGFICVLLIYLVFVTQRSFAGTDPADSLKQAIQDKPHSRKAADNLLALAEAYRLEYLLDSAVKYANRARDLATDLDYTEGIAESYYKLHIIEQSRSNFKKALKYVAIFNEICEDAGYEARLGKGYLSYGVLLGKKGEVDSSLLFIRKSLGINTKLNDTVRLIATYNSMGNIYKNQSEYDSAASYYLKSIRLAELSERLNYLGAIYNNLGAVFSRMNEYENARSYLEKALAINQMNEDFGLTAQTYTTLGETESKAGDTEKALSYFNQAEQLYAKTGNLIGQADILNNKANIYKDKAAFMEALDNYKKANAIYSDQEYTEGITITLMNIGQVYTAMGKFDLAGLYLDSCLQIATGSGYLQNRCSALFAISDNLYKAGEYKKAYDYYNLHFILSDSLINLEKSKALNELDKKYQKEKDQARILSLEKENLNTTIQRNVVVFSAVGLVMLTLFIVLYFTQRSRKDRIIARQKIIQLEEEKKLMTARLLVEGQEEERKRIARELHDGLGVLLSVTKMQFTTIKDKSPENQPMIDKATQLLEQASGDVRRLSHNMMPGLLTKLGFYDAAEDLIDNICDIEGMDAVFKIEGDLERLPENKEIMLYRIVQEMVNNTLKHAKAKNVALVIKRTDPELELRYSDDGTGFNPEIREQAAESSFGLRSIWSRVGFLNGTVELKTSPGYGTKYHIRIPV